MADFLKTPDQVDGSDDAVNEGLDGTEAAMQPDTGETEPVRIGYILCSE